MLIKVHSPLKQALDPPLSITKEYLLRFKSLIQNNNVDFHTITYYKHIKIL